LLRKSGIGLADFGSAIVRVVVIVVLVRGLRLVVRPNPYTD
jgi:hypothetical protein